VTRPNLSNQSRVASTIGESGCEPICYTQMFLTQVMFEDWEINIGGIWNYCLRVSLGLC
jgi:hypothetical protein